ncbi:CHASE3 domain-containing protein [Paenibacillus daejeonensis]|uniref:CHASE3 domain-containing protein n=1 Tax=Paenibacillus daejeonensis TaxID=135193 RepID=UPI000369BC27|nr:CHASE3 domain-containing protein [Paenibacillus daejeonensis]
MFKKLKWGIRAKIIFGYTVVILFLTIAILLVGSQLTALQKEIDYIADHDIEVHDLTNRLERHMLNLETGQRGYMITGRNSYLEPYNRSKSNWEQDYNLLHSLIGDNEKQQITLEAIKAGFVEWISTVGDPSIAMKEQQNDEGVASFFITDPGKRIVDQSREKFSSFRSEERALTNARTESLGQQNMWLQITLYTALVIVSALALAIAFTVSGSIVRAIREINNAVRLMASPEGDMSSRITVNTRDEIYELVNSTNGLLDNVEQSQWLQVKVTELISEHQSETDITGLSQSFVNRISELLDASYGVLYLRKRNKNGDEMMVRQAAYAIPAGSQAPEAFAFGEGLVGQAAKDKRIFQISDVPSHYYRITSGLGESQPQHLIVAPSCFENEVVAIVELASFMPFNEQERELLSKTMESFGAIINSAASRQEIEELLQESQTLTEELQSQSEELQAQQEEMRVTNEQLEEQNRLAELKSQELEKISKALEANAEQLKQSSRYKSEFLANISHELRTPLNSMLILSQILSENQSNHLDKDEQKYATVIHSAGEDLLNLINDILDLSKVEAGKLDIVMEEMSVTELTSLLMHQFEKTSEQKALDFHVEVAPDSDEIFYTDSQRLHQIMKNLLSNAFKFTEQGSVTFAVRKAKEEEIQTHLPTQAGRTVLALRVTDTGIGIAKDKQALIFEAFQQADGTTSRKYGGTGLGLSICRELTTLLGGTMTIKSEPDEGSTFTVYIPSMEPNYEGQRQVAAGEQLATAQSNAAVSQESEERNLSRKQANEPMEEPQEEELSTIEGLQVLVVDDDERNIFALTNSLEREGLRIHAARNGQEALDALATEQGIALVLMDIMMPVMDGYTAIRKIREQPEHVNLPIIALTAKAMKEDRDRCLEAGASDYISKPVDLRRLLSMIRVWLSKQAGR